MIQAEYIWIDGFGNVRSKSRMHTNNSELPEWNYDGSSTGQANSEDSEIIIKPVKTYKDPFRKHGILVLCDCYDKNNNPIPSNHRYNAQQIFSNPKVASDIPWFGIEQEYVLYNAKKKIPLGWSKKKEPEPQGKYYCSVGGDRAFGREIVEEHYEACIYAGINICGVNAEVMPSQWEFQIGIVEGINAADQLWVARYILQRVCEKYNAYASFEPKPVKGDWNGSGCHTNFSTASMRGENGILAIEEGIHLLEAKHDEHIKVYGNNEERLIGTHETSSINKFTWGVGDRTASIRIPTQTKREGAGYLEDRRPASDCDPYLVTAKLAQTVLLS